MHIKDQIQKFVPSSIMSKWFDVKNLYLRKYSERSYSQEGEDMVLRTLFADQPIGFYVDVGALHPKLYSNTYYFYKKGWRGINIDAMPDSMKSFDALRPRDINIEKPISDKKETLRYFVFNNPALNSFSEKRSKTLNDTTDYTIIDTLELETSTLGDILDEYLPQNQTIDFLTVDAEGLDLAVLRSNNFHKYNPRVILAEVHASDLQDALQCEITSFLTSKNYLLLAKTLRTAVFVNLEIATKMNAR